MKEGVAAFAREIKLLSLLVEGAVELVVLLPVTTQGEVL